MSIDSVAANPHIFWLFGLSGSGKSTLAAALRTNLAACGIPSLALDGDSVRAGLCAGLGFSDEDRTENLRRAAEVARLALASGLSTVASFITPLAAHRNLVRDIVGPDRVSLIYLNAPLETCRGRDVKGLYRRAADGSVPQMTGLTSRFEPPACADFVVNTGRQPPEASAADLCRFALARFPAT